MMIKKICVWRGCLFGMVLGLVVLAGCSKPVEVVQEPTKEDPVAIQSPVEVELPAIPVPLETDSKNLNLLSEYAGHLQAGNLMRASANLASLKSHLKGENLDDPFWIENLPPDNRMILLIGALCATCPDGACLTCKGHGDCQTCNGTGKCKLCQGRGGEWKPCQKCICTSCQGRRLCPGCQGRRYQNCLSCNGSGNGREEKKFTPCPSCGGRGVREGLKGPNGAGVNYKCLRCNGSQGTYSTVRYPCATCDGTGQKKCETCRGNGVCPTCRGQGRLANCPICTGQGRYLDPCTTCNGTKNCPVCSGSKLCQSCKGQGTCRDCLGHNLVIRHRFPIDRNWLLKPEARFFHPGPEGVRSDSLTGTTATVTIKGRNVSIDVPEGSLLWASTTEDLRVIRDIFKPAP